MPTLNSPLPFPADEIRAEAVETISHLQSLIGRLLIFYRGHQKDCSGLNALQVRLLSDAMTLSHLSWPHTECEIASPLPPLPTPAGSADQQPPTTPPTPGTLLR